MRSNVPTTYRLNRRRQGSDYPGTKLGRLAGKWQDIWGCAFAPCLLLCCFCCEMIYLKKQRRKNCRIPVWFVESGARFSIGATSGTPVPRATRANNRISTFGLELPACVAPPRPTQIPLTTLIYATARQTIQTTRRSVCMFYPVK